MASISRLESLIGGGERPPLIAVCGAADATPDNERDAEEVGRLIAESGGIVLCGGMGEGVMCAAARGAKAGGGLSVGLLASDDVSEAAPDVGLALPTGLGELTNAVLPRACSGMVAIGRGYGTLAEVAHAVKLGRPVVALGSWEIRPPGASEVDSSIHGAASPRQAVEWVMQRASAVGSRIRERHSDRPASWS